MMIKKLLVPFVFIAIFAISCEKKEEIDPFAIGPDRIGKLSKTATVKELDSIYATDSIVRRVAGDEFIGNTNEIEIYDKQGKQLLILTPSEEFDSIATIKTIRVIDPRFKTEKGIGTASTFKQIEEAYQISDITNMLSTVQMNIDEINAFIAIDKKQLPSELHFNTEAKIEAVQIKDSANIKYFWLDWE